MASRTYAQISCTLPASKKMRQLNSHEARWAYICVHLSPLGNYTGLFRYPLSVWAEDAAMTPDDLRARLLFAFSAAVSIELSIPDMALPSDSRNVRPRAIRNARSVSRCVSVRATSPRR